MQELVRAAIGDREVTVGAAYAEAKGLEVIDASTRREDGRKRPTTRRDGRKAKPRVSVAEAAEKKAAAQKDAEPAPPASEGDSAGE